MRRAVIVAIVVLGIAAPVLAQDAPRVGVISLSYVARSSKAGQSSLAEIEKSVSSDASCDAANAMASSRLPRFEPMATAIRGTIPDH